MRQWFNNFISVVYSAIRFGLLKILNGHNFTYHIIERVSPNVILEVNRGGIVELGRRVRIHSGSKIKVRKAGKLIIGDGVKINYYCIIACHHYISIGSGTEFGPSVYLYDHDHDYRSGLKSNIFKVAPISIGRNCWIGANTVILRGTHIGDNCVIAAGSIVNGNIPDNSVFIQKKHSELIPIAETSHIFHDIKDETL